MFYNFSLELKNILLGAKKEMKDMKHSYIGTEHFILSLLKEDTEITTILNNYNITYDSFKEKIVDLIGYGSDESSLFVFTPLMKKILEDSILISQDNKSDVQLSTVFNLLLDEGEGVAFRIFCNYINDIDELYEKVNNMNLVKNNNSSYLENIGINLNNKVINKEIEDIIGREKEVSRLIEIICRKNKSNPLLIGDAGVGKTAIVEALAERIVEGTVPLKLQNKKIISVSMANLVSGTKYRGEFEEKVLKLVNELEKNNDVILFIDEIHTLVGAGGAEGAIDANNILKPALARGKIKVIGATTINEYKKYIEEDKALARRFQTILVEEPDKDSLLNILKRIKTNYEEYHGVEIKDEILEYIIDIANKYLIYRKEPDRSIDILDEVSSRVSIFDNNYLKENCKYKKELSLLIDKKNDCIKSNNFEEAIEYRKREREILNLINKNDYKLSNIKRKITISKEDVNRVVESMCNTTIFDDKASKSVALKLKNELKRRSVSKNQNIDLLLISIENNLMKFKKDFSYIFVGINKLYKDSIVNAFGNILYNHNIINIDLSEYSEEHTISKIIGSPPGYVGYQNKNGIFESLKEKPSSLIVFDNYDESCSSIKNLIKEIINKRYIIDSSSQKINFKNCGIIIISNENKKSIGFLNKSNSSDKLIDGVDQIFYFNNIDEKIKV